MQDTVMAWTASMRSDNEGDVVFVELEMSSGEIVHKRITFSDFKEALDGSVEQTGYLETGKVPHGYYDGCISTDLAKTFRCIIIVPSGKKTITYFDTLYEIPYPTTVFSFDVQQGNLHKSSVYFLKTDAPNDESVLYQYVFGNVASTTGSICWGSIMLPELTSMKDCDKLVALFFGSPCNDDYFSYARFATGAPEYCQTQRALYEHLKSCEVFPLEILAPTASLLGNLLKK